MRRRSDDDGKVRRRVRLTLGIAVIHPSRAPSDFVSSQYGLVSAGDLRCEEWLCAFISVNAALGINFSTAPGESSASVQETAELWSRPVVGRDSRGAGIPGPRADKLAHSTHRDPVGT
jgi:hypothetical protein